MKMKKKKFLYVFLAAALAIGLFAALPLTAFALDSAVAVTEHPAGTMYILNASAEPLKASFRLTRVNDEIVDKITVQWFISNANSTADRSNGQAENAAAFDADGRLSVTYMPATDAPGVKYYFAVCKYDVTASLVTNAENETKEAVSDPARIEVVTGQYFDVKKTDENGNPLPGAVISLANASGDPNDDSYEETTKSDGTAKFFADEGRYKLSEKKAPEGYDASDETYDILVTPDGVFFNTPGENQADRYKTVIFVNKKKPTATPLRSPAPIASASPEPTLAPSATPNAGAAAGEKSFRVKKTDEAGNLQSGAVFILMPDSGYTPNAATKTYEETTVNGYAVFTAAAGQYILGEKAAPAGYNASDVKYTIRIAAGDVFIVDSAANTALKYEIITYVNKKIPALNKDDHFAYMQGYPEGDFRPEKNMTRAEAVVMFSRLLSESMDLTKDHRYDCYPDVEWNNISMSLPWYANQVCYMHRLGVLADYSRDARFRPDEPVTRAEFATLAAHFDNLALTDENKFSDVPRDHWALKYINSAAAKGWVTGYPDGTFKPEALITRAEVVTLVNRMLDRAADEAYLKANAASLPRNYWDFDVKHWAYYRIMEASLGHDYIKDEAGEHWTAVYK